jgi:hypothetical protein
MLSLALRFLDMNYYANKNQQKNKYRCESNCSGQSMNIPLITLCEVAENVEPRPVNRDDLTRSRPKFRSPRITINQKVDMLRLCNLYKHTYLNIKLAVHKIKIKHKH